MIKSNITVKNGINVSVKGMTEGEFMSLVRALVFYGSPVGNDVLGYIQDAAFKYSPGFYDKVMEYVRDAEKDIEREEVRRSAANNALKVLNAM